MIVESPSPSASGSPGRGFPLLLLVLAVTAAFRPSAASAQDDRVASSSAA